MSYSLAVKDCGVAIVNAPPFALLSIEFLTHMDRGMKVRGNMVTIGGGMLEGEWTTPTSYEIIGLTNENRALMLRREDVDGDPPPDMR